MPRASRAQNTDPISSRFLAASIIGAVNTANATKPLSRRGRASVACFFPSWLTSELPLHVIAWQAVASVIWIRRGALRSPKGWLALALNVGSWAALVKIWKQSTTAGDVLESALEEALGEELVEGSVPNVTSSQLTIERRRIIAGPVARWKTRYVSDHNLAYGDAGRRNQLDIWHRSDLPLDGKAPVLLQVHGGAWIIGNKDQQALPLLGHMAENGWVCVSINYRLSPRATWPEHIVDVKRAIAWVKANIAQYGGDPDFVAITGGSAGGHLSSLAALTANEPMFQPGFEEADTTVVAAVPFYGVYDWTNRDGTGNAYQDEMLARLVLKTTKAESPDLWRDGSTMSWVSADAPPFFVVHGSNDVLVPVEQARSFVAMLRSESKNPVAYAELPGAQHAFEVFDSPRTIFSAGAVHRFLETIRRREGHGATVEAGTGA
ncbi:alpha/beta hydrolase fold domain-containing protein [Aquihabitans sp. McL0605]|uniref:alpha/beta hydrolase fold domain-containing protein n=1 Tax=Aquihabitans sp. McL0605 TaxID=3415671 RepID=UPI003CF79B3A